MSNKTVQPHKSSLANLDANVVALLSYLIASLFLIIPALGYIAWVVPLVVYLLETKSTFVKNHAMQSLVIHAISAIVGLIFNVILGGLIALLFAGPFSVWSSIGIVSVFRLLTSIVGLAVLIFSILAMIRAYQYTEYNIPFIGPIVSWVINLFSGKKGSTTTGAAGGAEAGATTDAGETVSGTETGEGVEAETETSPADSHVEAVEEPPANEATTTAAREAVDTETTDAEAASTETTNAEETNIETASTDRD